MLLRWYACVYFRLHCLGNIIAFRLSQQSKLAPYNLHMGWLQYCISMSYHESIASKYNVMLNLYVLHREHFYFIWTCVIK